MFKARLAPKLTNNYRKTSVELETAITLRHLDTWDSFRLLHYQFRVGRSPITQFVVTISRAIQEEFTAEHSTCPTTQSSRKSKRQN